MAGGVISVGKPHEAQSGGLFKHEVQSVPNYSGDIANLSRRIRILEEKNTNAQNRMEIVEQNMISRHKQTTSEIKTILSEINELKTEIIELKDRMLMLIKELQMSAKKEQVTILKRYVDLWEPVNFVTHNEVDELVTEAVRKAMRNRKV